jgi:hypothetical protein
MRRFIERHVGQALNFGPNDQAASLFDQLGQGFNNWGQYPTLRSRVSP